MTSITLAQAGLLVNDEIVSSIAEDIFTTNPIWGAMPWTPYTGQAIIVPREDVIGDTEHLAIGGTITAKAAATYDDSAVFTATTTIGDAEMNGLVQAQSASDGVDELMNQISSKAKSVGRKLQTGFAVGDGTGANLNSVHTLTDASQYTAASAGQALSLELMDELLDLVKAKDGEVDFLMAPGKIIRAYKTLVRALGGITETMAFTMPNGTERTVSVYEGIPLFQNDYLSVAETANGAALTGGALASMYAGVWDDGTKKVGASMIHPAGTPFGIDVSNVGVAETKDETITRVKSYSNFANFNRRGLARLPSLNN